MKVKESLPKSKTKKEQGKKKCELQKDTGDRQSNDKGS
jgi:hypothetical protein